MIAGFVLAKAVQLNDLGGAGEYCTSLARQICFPSLLLSFHDQGSDCYTWL